MKRPVRDPVKRTYTIRGGGVFKELFGSREQVMNGTAYKTKYGLTKDGLVMNKWGRIVSKDKHVSAKKEKRLERYGYTARKGKFGCVRKTKRKGKTVYRKCTKKQRLKRKKRTQRKK